MVIERINFICLILFSLITSAVFAENTSFTVYPDRVLNKVDEKVYGHFLEHIFHSVNGGLWGELIWDRSFEGSGLNATWEIIDNCVIQEGMGPNVKLIFGDPDWSDYEFTMEACKTGGDEGFFMHLRVLNEKEYYWTNFGGWGNTGHGLERGIKGNDRWEGVTPHVEGQIETGRWYTVRGRCEGPRIRFWLDDKLIIDYTDDGKGPTHGRVGVGTWTTQAKFRNLKVTSLDGKTLYEGLPPLPRQHAGNFPLWQSFGVAKVSTSTENPLNGKRCRKIESQGEPGGLTQQPLCIRAGEVYAGSFWALGKVVGDLIVRLKIGDKILAQQSSSVSTEDWKEFPIKLKPTASANEAAIEIMVKGKGTVWIDQVSLMPESWRQSGGYRADLFQAVADLRPPIIRWPGGCYASPYRWKDGIGPQHKRGAFPIVLWDDKDVNAFGTDEFIAMCRKLGAEPLIVVNIGTHFWNHEVLDNNFLQEVCDWIEYCNGPADSTWGKVRAANGHPEPYNVKYWEIDNETWHMKPEEYADWVNRFAPAMRKMDPSIKLTACGSGYYGENESGFYWNRVLIERCADKVDYLSVHNYELPERFASGPDIYEQYIRRTEELIAHSKNPNLKLNVSEWNTFSWDWRAGLYCGGILNAFERCGDIVGIAGPAIFLRHVSGSDAFAFIWFDQCCWLAIPNYVVMKLWRDHYAPLRVEIDSYLCPLNVVATKTEDGKTLYLKAVNPFDYAVTARATIADDHTPDQPTMTLITADSPLTENTFDNPDVIKPITGKADLAGNAILFEMPPFSAAVVTIPIK
ncbi:MAG: DUF1080 domain-containing protein [Sedimentisphaerales bacterium]|nr:DUF1080 domain-containing protein [Sedimentisphaerales bacterium]